MKGYIVGIEDGNNKKYTLEELETLLFSPPPGYKDYVEVANALEKLTEEKQVDARIELGDALGAYKVAFLENQMGETVDLSEFEREVKAAAGNRIGDELIRAAKKDVENLLADTLGRSR